MSSQAHERPGQGAEEVCPDSVKRLSRKSCLKCLKRGDVLMCSHADCPIVVHKSCMPCPARFDDTGNFLCPYCLYKRSLNEYDQAKDQALFAKKALVSFLDSKKTSSCDPQTADSLIGKNIDESTVIRHERDISSSKVDADGIHIPQQVEGAKKIASSGLGIHIGDFEKAGPSTCSQYQGKDSAVEGARYLMTKCDKSMNTMTSSLDACTNRSAEQAQRVPQGNIVGEGLVVNERTDNANETACQSDNNISGQKKLLSENVDQFALIVKDQRGSTIDKSTEATTTKNATFSTISDSDLVTQKDSGNQTRKHLETARVVEESHERIVEKEQTQLNKPLEKQDHYGPDAEKTMPKMRGQVSCSTRKINESVICEQKGIPASEHQENIITMDRFLDVLAKEVQTGTEPSNQTKGDLKYMEEEELEEENCSLFRDKNIIATPMAIDEQSTEQASIVREDRCRRASEGLKVSQSKGAVNSSTTETSGPTFGKSDNMDKSESSQESHAMQHRRRSKRKIQPLEFSDNDDQTWESSGSVGSEVEESIEVAHRKAGQKVNSAKQIKSPALPSARRRKLPWTVEEVEMLKEGVQKFSLTANKNLPWTKILEFGRHIFDGTRTPADLKDKWRNIVGKAHANSIEK